MVHRILRMAVAMVPAILGGVIAFLAAAGWLILDEATMAHAALLVGTVLVALGGLFAGGFQGRLEDTPEQEERHHARVRTAGIFVRLLAIVALLVLAGSLYLAWRDPAALPHATIDRVARMLTAALAIACAGLVTATLVTRRMRPGGLRMGTVGLMAAVLLAVVAVAVHIYGAAFVARFPQVPNGLAALATAAMLGLSMPAARGVPGLGAMLSPPSRPAARQPGVGKAFVPAAVAFGLVVVIFLLIILFGVGVGPVVQQVGRSPGLAAAAGFIVLLLVGAVVGVFAMSRRTPATVLFKEKVDPRKRFEQLLLASSILLGMFFLVPAALDMSGYLDLPKDAWRHLLCVGTMIAVGPYGFYIAKEQKRIRRLEERFPDFLRDVASSHKGGLTLPGAIVVAARGEYGPLTGEIRKMGDQLQWNVPFSEALRLFAERVRTPLVQRAVNLILEANRTGGSTTGLLLAAARDAREIKSLENERRLTMSLYTVVIYVTFFVFLGVAATLYSQFIPQLVASSNAATEAAAEGVNVQGVGGGSISIESFQKFYFLAGVLQGVGDGIVAGMMGSGRVLAGLQHAFWMVLFSYVTFTFLL